VIREVGFTIKPKFDSATAQKNIDKMKTSVKEIDKAQEKLHKMAVIGLRQHTRYWKELGLAAKEAGKHMKEGWKGAFENFEKMNSKIDSMKSKMLNFKNLAKEGVVGFFAYEGMKEVFEAGKEKRAKTRRLEGIAGEDAEMIKKVAEMVQKKSGVESQMGLISLYEQGIQETRAGSKLGKLTLNDKTAQKAREQTMSNAANAMSRIMTARPDMDPERVGTLLAAAGTNESAIIPMLRQLNFGAYRFKAKRLIGANAKGDLYKELSKEQREEFGVKKHGDKAKIGDLNKLVLDSIPALSEKELDHTRRTFDYQVRSIKTSFNDVLENIGESALNKLEKAFTKGESLAERFEKFIGSPEGKKMIDSMGDAIENVVSGLTFLVEKLPSVINFIAEHKGSLLTVAAAYTGLRAAGQLKEMAGVFKGGGGAGGAAEKVAEALGMGKGSMGGVQKVWVTNWGGKTPPPLPDGIGGEGLGAAGGKASKGAKMLSNLGNIVMAAGIGYAVGEFLDETFGISDKLSHIGDSARKAAEDKGVAAHKNSLAGITATKAQRIAALEAAGLSHGKAVMAADQLGGDDQGRAHGRGAINFGDFHITGMITAEQAKQVAAEVEKRLLRTAQNKTQGGT
jgi:hypothetical protein